MKTPYSISNLWFMGLAFTFLLLPVVLDGHSDNHLRKEIAKHERLLFGFINSFNLQGVCNTYLNLSKLQLKQQDSIEAETAALNALLSAYEVDNYTGIYEALSLLKKTTKSQDHSLPIDFLERRMQLTQNPKKWLPLSKTLKTVLHESTLKVLPTNNFQEEALVLVSKAITSKSTPNFKEFEKLIKSSSGTRTKGLFPFQMLYFNLRLEALHIKGLEATIIQEIQQQIEKQDLNRLATLHLFLESLYITTNNIDQLELNGRQLELISLYQKQNTIGFSEFYAQYKSIKASPKRWAWLLIGGISASLLLFILLSQKRKQRLFSAPTESSLVIPLSELPNPLTPRETEVLRALSKGKTNAGIADELCISLNTVKTHISKIYEKLDVKNRTQAADKGRLFLKSLNKKSTSIIS